MLELPDFDPYEDFLLKIAVENMQLNGKLNRCQFGVSFGCRMQWFSKVEDGTLVYKPKKTSMESQVTPTTEQQTAVNELYSYAANMLVNENKSHEEVKAALIEKGLSDSAAYTIVSGLEDEIYTAKQEQAKKDMLYGALWLIGGTIATLANIGFIFWGAILFGGIQFIKGLVGIVSKD